MTHAYRHLLRWLPHCDIANKVKNGGVTNLVGIQNQSHAFYHKGKRDCAIAVGSKHGQRPSNVDLTKQGNAKNIDSGVPIVSNNDVVQHYPLQQNRFRSCLVTINGIPVDKQDCHTMGIGHYNIAWLVPHLPIVAQ